MSQSSSDNPVPSSGFYRWSAIPRRLQLALLLVLVTASISLLYFQHMQQQLEQSRLHIQSQQSHTLTQFMASINLQLRQIESAIRQARLPSEANQDDVAALHSRHFLPRWDDISHVYQPRFLALYRPDGSALLRWPGGNTDRRQEEFIASWLQRLSPSRQAQSAIFCKPQSCALFRFSMLQDGQTPAAVLVSALSLQPVLNLFTDKQHNDGILLAATSPQTSTDLLVYKWGYQFFSTAADNTTSEVLKQFAQSTVSPPQPNTRDRLSHDQRDYQITTLPLLPADASLLVIVQDISQAQQAVFINSLQMALLIFIALLMTGWILSRQKPQTEASMAPDIAGDQPVPTKIEAPDWPISTAEPGISSPAIHAAEYGYIVDGRIELLQRQNKAINQQLSQQMLQLGNERDRANRILANAQAIIMTLREDGSIDSINRYGEKVTGFSSSELCGKNFIDLYSDKSPPALNDLQVISNVTQGLQTHFQHEVHINRKNGEDCIIQWYHCRLDCKNSSAPLLLTTGLDITEHRKLEKNLSWLVNHDNLTTLFNRRRFERELEAAVNWSKKQRTDGVLLTIDLDNFKDINDSCGHKVGDIILRKVAAALVELTRPIDASAHKVTARLGGDEFAVILRQIDKQGGEYLAQRITKALNGISHFQQNISFKLSASIGIASFGDAANNATELLSNANYARNQAKADGRNQQRVFNPQHSHIEQTHYRMLWRDRIENALRHDRFVLHFQPILNIRQNRISHYEVLIRMLDENNELIAPGLFIHIAEQFGLIRQIDDFIIAAAIARQGELVRQGQDLTLTINLSGKAFDDKNLYRKISQAIQHNHANPKHLVFEITETSAVSNLAAAQKVMTRIQALGCQFALDDFGVGFSSFHYLRKLPVDLVKIDGSFVTKLNSNADNKVLVKALSEVAIGFNKRTVAEFVDSLQTLDILRKASVNYAQGYFIGKPTEMIPVDLPRSLLAQQAGVRLH